MKIRSTSLRSVIIPIAVSSFFLAACAKERTEEPFRSEPIKVMLLTGQCAGAHDWMKSSPILAGILEDSGRFVVDAVITPPAGADMSGFAPDWSGYDVVVMDYDGDDWPDATREAFAAFVSGGGGLVSFHATDNAFPEWKPFLEMTGVGGWRGRDETWGPKLTWKDGRTVTYDTPGNHWHPRKHDFLIVTREPEHPVMRGLPESWMHACDELYAGLRGPAENVTVLATAVADPAQNDRSKGENEPMLMAIDYGKGRVFHTTLGHVGRSDQEPIRSVRCVGFITTFKRGTEWAASGEVTLPIPDDFPTADQPSIRDPAE